MTDQTSSGRPPTPDYPALSLGDIAHRARSLSAADLERLLAYERGHASRAPVLDLLTARLAQLEAGREPSSGGAAPPRGTPRESGRPEGDRRS
ncbi:hypothetical protein RM572_22575 [Streptomyces sp. DSM 42041]|uniref:DUF8129 domain-containing protein n=1 Tax=Streptomyces hazeniae TaxID=3075538 RepID=A0ABU2NZA2_9ACTN|nr:hypothetical protein [Streptomyces sp. DSM 42041]MDT0381548.1 hypothetical protein [Streptomyces sp. DSM 42041]